MKSEEDKDGNKSGGEKGGGRFGLGEGAQSEFTSTFQSLDLPPKEYEQQLQQYEAEVRNHIKVEQQLKLHIEVLQEKIDDLEKETANFDKKLESDKKAYEKKIKENFARLLE